jgi:hypothetical protein
MADDETTPRLKGEALWRQQREAIEQRNAAARKRAHEHESASDVATVHRERSLARTEADQLKVLNARLDARPSSNA